MHVVFAASEAAPWSKSGGLGDVAGALPRRLAADGATVTLIIPDYAPPAGDRPAGVGASGEISVRIDGVSYPVTFHTLKESTRFRIVWVRQDLMFRRPFLYGDGVLPYPDNLHRFLVFQYAVAAWIDSYRGGVDIAHLNDWQTALLPLILRRNPPRRGRPATVFTIHNLAYQGIFPGRLFPILGLSKDYFTPDSLEFFGDMNSLKGGIIYGDAVTTVSPTYAGEILEPEFGAGLEGVLRRYRHKLTGILNGADYGTWDPGGDPHIERNYGTADVREGKAANRTALMNELELKWPPDTPLAVAVTRLAHQKGADIMARALERLAPDTLRAIILGTGDSALEARLQRLAARNPGIYFIPRFDEAMAHRLQAAADLFLMPSRYEPCGLAQMYALRYGTLPVVHKTGGLADTVMDADAGAGGTGFLFSRPRPAAFARALIRAARAVGDPARLAGLRAGAMKQDFSWNRSAGEYARLYENILHNGDNHVETGNP